MSAATLRAVEVRVAYAAWLTAWTCSTSSERLAYGLTSPSQELAAEVAASLNNVPVIMHAPVEAAARREFVRLYEGQANRTALLGRASSLSAARHAFIATTLGKSPMTPQHSITGMAFDHLVRVAASETASVQTRFSRHITRPSKADEALLREVVATLPPPQARAVWRDARAEYDRRYLGTVGGSERLLRDASEASKRLAPAPAAAPKDLYSKFNGGTAAKPVAASAPDIQPDGYARFSGGTAAKPERVRAANPAANLYEQFNGGD